jgi:thioredoxin-like negative regulator of GroEL
MDCRGTTLLALVGLVSVVVGCTPQKTLPIAAPPPLAATTPPPPSPPPPEPSSTSESKLPKRTPSAAMCLAVGQMREQDMDEPDRTPGQREVLADHARKSYQQAIRLEPQNVAAHHALARLYVKLKQPDQALETYRKAIKLKPTEASLWFEVGMCNSRQKQWEPALEALAKACELAPDNRPYTQTYAFALARAGRYDESLAAFQKVVSPAAAHFNLARMLLHLEQKGLARQHLLAATQLDPQLGDAQKLLTQIDGGSVPVAAPDSQPAAAPERAVRPVGLLTLETDDEPVKQQR